MKKTWTTKVLIALLTLALVVGVCVVAPKAADAAGNANFVITPDSLDDGTKDVLYSDKAVNVTGPYNPRIQSSTFTGAAGLVWTQATQTLGGTPTATGDCTLNITFVDDNGNTYAQVYTFKINPAPIGPQTLTVPSLAGLKVGTAFSGQCSATGGYPDSYTYSCPDLPAGLQISSSGLITGTPTTAAPSGSCHVTVSNTTASKTETVSYAVAKGDVTLSIDGPTSVARNSSITLTAVGAPAGVTTGFVWTKGNVATGHTGPTYTYSPSSTDTSPIAIGVTWNANGANANYVTTGTATKQVTIDAAKATVSIQQPANNASYPYSVPGTPIYLRGTSNVTECLWTVSNNASGTISNETSLTGASYTISNADIGKTLTFTLTSPTTAGTYSPGTASVNVNIYNDDVVMQPSSNYTMSFTGTTLYDTQTFIASTARSGNVRITNSNPSAVTVTAAGQTVGSGGVTVPSGTQVSVKAIAYGRSYVDIVPENGSSANGKRITVYVGSQTPTIQAQFWSSDNCTTTLTKRYNWGTLKITVDNYNPAYPYVTVTRSNIRTYVQGGSYYSHPSTYVYTAALTQDLSDPLKATATLYVIPQYNGSTHYTVAYTNATNAKNVNSPTIYVTGFPTLPQTGPNYIWAYVLGGLCLATVATAVTLNVRKKKREDV